MHLRASNTLELQGGAQGPQTPAAGAEHRASRFLPIFSLGTSQN